MRYLFLIIFSFLIQFSFSQDLIPYRVGNNWGYCDKKGKVIIKPKYDEAGEFRHKLTWVKKNGKYWYINRKGCRKSLLKYDEANYFGFGTAKVKRNGKTYCINLKGFRTKCKAGCGGAFGIRVFFNTYRKNGKIGIEIYSDENNGPEKLLTTRVKTPAIWTYLIENRNRYAAVKKGEFWGVINESAELVAPYQYSEMETSPGHSRGNKFFKIKNNGLWGFLDEEGKPVIEPKYQKVEFFTRQGIAKVWVDEYFWGYINESGEEFFKTKR